MLVIHLYLMSVLPIYCYKIVFTVGDSDSSTTYSSDDDEDEDEEEKDVIPTTQQKKSSTALQALAHDGTN